MTRAFDALAVGLCLWLGVSAGSQAAASVRRATATAGAVGLNQQVFGTALLAACGREGTPMTDGSADPSLRPVIDFLAQRLDRISCEQIPFSIPIVAASGMQTSAPYLQRMATSAFRLGGTDWSAIDRLLGLLLGITAVLSYVLCALTHTRVGGVIVAGALLSSPMQLANLVDLRDYAKAPFFLFSLVAIAVLVTSRRPAVLLIWSAIAGAVFGVGFGIRTDIAINMATTLLALLAFSSYEVPGASRVRAGGAVLCVLGFMLTALPALRSGQSGENLWHWALLGYAHEWDRTLGIAPAPYDLNYFYSDSYTATTIDAFWSRTTGTTAKMSVGVPGYGDASRTYYQQLVRIFPADILTRGWASVLKILELPLDTWAPRLRGLGIATFLLVVFGLCWSHPRLAVLLFTLTALLAAYPAVQFQQRHFFHLEVIPLWLMAFAASAAVSWIAARRSRTDVTEGVPIRLGLRRIAVLAAGMAVVVFVPLMVLREIQQHRAATLFAAYQQSEWQPLSITTSPLPDGLMRLASGETAFQRPRGERSTYSEMLLVEVGADRCAVESTTLAFQYVAADHARDFSRQFKVAVPEGNGRTQILFPIYESGSTSPPASALEFAGVELAATDAACITKVAKLRHPDAMPTLLPVVLQPDWASRPLYQRVAAWEGQAAAEQAVAAYWFPQSLRSNGAAWIRRGRGAQAGMATPVEFQSRIADVTADGKVEIRGRADAPGSYLAAWRPQRLTANDALYVEGRVAEGGVTIGLTTAAGWAGRVDIDRPGPFRAVIAAPDTGDYQVVLANYLTNGSLVNKGSIDLISVIHGIP